MDNFPQMLYRFPAQGVDAHQLHDENMRLWTFDTCIVPSEDVRDEKLASGWAETPPDARQVHFQAVADAAAIAAGENAADKDPTDDKPPTREELEAKAKELGIEFDGRTTDKSLAKKIGEALSKA